MLTITNIKVIFEKIHNRNHPELIIAYDIYLKNPNDYEAYRNWKIEQIRAFSNSEEEFERYKEHWESMEQLRINNR